MKRQLPWLLSLMAFAAPSFSNATVTLLDKDDWKVQMSGFVEMDMFHDSKRGFTEVVGNTAVPRPSTTNMNNAEGRSQFSIRNSRFAFSILPPEVDGWKTKGYMEFDLLGYDPSPSNTAPTNSEASFYTNPSLRVRHAFLNAENNGWQILAGQTWTLFGWEPTYVLTTASVPPGPGTLYQRTEQLTGFKNIEFSSEHKLLVGASMARPSQRDSSMPNFDVGAKYAFSGLSAGFASPSGDVSAQPLSVALSGTVRQFVVAKGAAVEDGTATHNGSAFAVDAMIPILPSTDGKETGNTIVLTGEFSNGTGYADSFPSWTGGLSQYAATAAGAASTLSSVDAGQGVFVGDTFNLIKIQTWNAQLQYHLPASLHSFITLGHAELWSNNLSHFANALANYDRSKMDFINIFHDFTPQVRGALEYAKFETHYVDGTKPTDDRWEVNAYFRF